MKTIKFKFPDLPINTNVVKWKKGVISTIDFGGNYGKTSTMWTENDNDNIILEVIISIEFAEILICDLHNIHLAQVI